MSEWATIFPLVIFSDMIRSAIRFLFVLCYWFSTCLVILKVMHATVLNLSRKEGEDD